MSNKEGHATAAATEQTRATKRKYIIKGTKNDGFKTQEASCEEGDGA